LPASSDESLEQTLQLVLRKAVLAAAKEASAESDSTAARVHGVRKRIKRIRAILRLVRDGIDCDDYRREQAWLRERGRRLSQARDAEVLVETHRRLCKSAAGKAHSRSHDDDVLQALERFRDETHAASEPGGLLREAAADLQGKAVEWQRTPLRIADPLVIEAALEPSLKRYARALRRAERSGTATKFHTLRKRVKDVTYQMDFVAGSESGIGESLRRRASSLGRLLGWQHDVVMYSDQLRRMNDVPKKSRAVFTRTAMKERKKLRKRTLRNGHRFLVSARKKLER